MANVVVMKCDCRAHAFQDAAYGAGNRAFNRTRASDGQIYRCTHCGQERKYGEAAEAKPAKGQKAKK